ncbi:MAG: hypothetical protein IJG32_01775, partial [Selenomonadaceae bacterium]|nr:hypothetical protein [Selenomonadaceae bacterium]
SRDVDKYIETTQGYELAAVVESSGDDFGGQTGTSTLEKTEKAVDEPTSVENFSFEHDGDSAAMNFGESLSSRREYEESWEQFINGA